MKPYFSTRLNKELRSFFRPALTFYPEPKSKEDSDDDDDDDYDDENHHSFD